MLLSTTVEPGWSWWIVNPRMIRPGVIHHLILNNFDTKGMRSIHQLAQFLECPKVLFNGVEILRVVSVKACARSSLFQFNFIRMVVIVIPGCQPDRGNTEVLKVVKSIDYSLKI